MAKTSAVPSERSQPKGSEAVFWSKWGAKGAVDGLLPGELDHLAVDAAGEHFGASAIVRLERVHQRRGLTGDLGVRREGSERRPGAVGGGDGVVEEAGLASVANASRCPSGQRTGTGRETRCPPSDSQACHPSVKPVPVPRPGVPGEPGSVGGEELGVPVRPQDRRAPGGEGAAQARPIRPGGLGGLVEVGVPDRRVAAEGEDLHVPVLPDQRGGVIQLLRCLLGEVRGPLGPAGGEVQPEVLEVTVHGPDRRPRRSPGAARTPPPPRTRSWCRARRGRSSRPRWRSGRYDKCLPCRL